MICMEITRKDGSRLKGACDEEDREGCVECQSVSHDMTLPHDARTGKAAGRREHSPVDVIKEMDVASPLLYQVLLTGEKLREVKIKSYRTKDGNEELFFTNILKGATVVDIQCQTLSGSQIEYLTIVYENIVWRYEKGGIESGDSWKAPKVSGR